MILLWLSLLEAEVQHFARCTWSSQDESPLVRHSHVKCAFVVFCRHQGSFCQHRFVETGVQHSVNCRLRMTVRLFAIHTSNACLSVFCFHQFLLTISVPFRFGVHCLAVTGVRHDPVNRTGTRQG